MTVKAFIFSSRDDLDVRIDLEAHYTPETADVRYLANGDPGHPGDPEEIDFHSVMIDGVETELTGDEEDRARLAVIEAAADYDPTE